jgi:23S rRNA pseudouridine1911/1915/1917 synthase
LIDHIERRDRLSRVVPSPTDCSQEARLRYTVLGRDSGKSLLKVSLETGRRHQIRIQLAHMGHPILGDLRYGAATPLPSRQIALLAHQLAVEHPTRGDRLLLASPIPLQWPWPDTGMSGGQGPPWDWRAFASDIVLT